MDPRIRDLAFGAALNSILQSAGMGTNIGSELRRIGTLPPPSPPSPPSSSSTPTLPADVTVPMSGGLDQQGPGMDAFGDAIGGATGGGISFGNPQTSITDSFGTPLTVGDLVGRGVDIISFLSNPLSFAAGYALTGKSTGQMVKGMMTPVETAQPTISLAQIALDMSQQTGLTPSEAMAVLTGGSHVEQSGTPAPGDIAGAVDVGTGADVSSAGIGDSVSGVSTGGGVGVM